MQFKEISLLYTTYTHTQLGGTAVCYASAEGHSEVVKLLVQAGADLELQTKVHAMEIIFLTEQFKRDI